MKKAVLVFLFLTKVFITEAQSWQEQNYRRFNIFCVWSNSYTRTVYVSNSFSFYNTDAGVNSRWGLEHYSNDIQRSFARHLESNEKIKDWYHGNTKIIQFKDNDDFATQKQKILEYYERDGWSIFYTSFSWNIKIKQ